LVLVCDERVKERKSVNTVEEVASMRKGWFIALAACVGLLGASSMAQAVNLDPGGSAPLVQEGTLGPPNVAQFGPLPFTFSTTNGVVRGTYQEFVSAGRPGSPLGGLSFEYQLTVTAGTSTDAVQAITAGGFGGWTTNVTNTPGGMVPFNFASRSLSLGGDGISALSAGGVSPGQSSQWLVIDTNAPAGAGFQSNFVAFSGEGGGTGALASFGPSPVPEPATLTLALVGLPVFGAFGYRRLRRGKPALA
jgi:hypothetical protein